MLRTRLDHLIVLASSLEEGCTYVADLLGVVPTAGGEHPTMGTHNALLRLYGGAYIEVLAPLPDVEMPSARWFGLDQPSTKKRLKQGPYLAHWVLALQRPQQLNVLQAQHQNQIAPIHSMQRGQYSWDISVPLDGALPSVTVKKKALGAGLIPSLIQWQTPHHPSQDLPEHDLALRQLRGFHAQAAELQPTLDFLGASAHLIIEPTLVEPSLLAEIEVAGKLKVLK